jgi:CHAT domain-containing protein
LTGSLDQAVREWELYLRINPAGPWAEQAQKHLENLTKQRHGLSTPSPTAPISEWAAYLESGAPNASEAALDSALFVWLSHRSARGGFSNSQASEIDGLLTTLAWKLEKEHRDKWLLRVLRSPWSPQLNKAFQTLYEAIQKNSTGSFDEGASTSRRAQVEFRRIGSIEGTTRAQLEEIYSHQRAVLSQSCVREAKELEHILVQRNFAAILIQVYLDKASCLNAIGRFREARAAVLDGVGLSRNSAYSILSLRAKGIEAGLATTRGDVWAALAEDSDGLRQFWTGQFPVERAHQFYSDITFNTERLRFWHVTYATDQEALLMISRSSRTELVAIARYRLAKAAIMLGLKATAESEVQQADNLFANLPQTATTLTYRVDAIVGLSRAQADVGDYEAAVRLLQRSISLFPPIESRLISKRLLHLNGDVALNTNKLPAADLAYSAAIDLAEVSLNELKTSYDRFVWSRENVSLYKSLAEVKIQEHDSVGALDIWESYKSAIFRNPQKITASPRSQFKAGLSIKYSNLRRPVKPSHVIVSYAILPHGPVAWVLDQHGLVTVKLSVSGSHLVMLAHEFARECSDPNSDLAELQNHAKELYKELLAPFAEHFTGATTLVVEPDPSVDSIPFEALITESGNYLIDHLAVIYSPGLDSINYLRDVQSITKLDKALIIGSPQLSAKWKAMLGSLPSADQEISFVAKQFAARVVLRGANASNSSLAKNLPGENILHFAGHAVDAEDGFGIVLTSRHIGTADPDFVNMADLPIESLSALKLVVLSACNTGTPDRIGFYHFVEPLFAAGVPQALVARWNIDSTTALQFMQEFYHQLLAGQDVAQAVRTATNHQRTETDHPYYWAAFALMGNY